MSWPGFSGLAFYFKFQQVVSSGVRLRSTRIDAAALALLLLTLSLSAVSILNSLGAQMQILRDVPYDEGRSETCV